MNQGQPKEQAHPAAVAQEFMRRADMKGGEVEAYAQTFNWLQTFLAGETIATPKEAHLALIEELKELRDFRREHDEAYEKAAAEEAGEIPVLEPEEDPEQPEGSPPDELEDVDSEASEQL